MTAAHGGAAHRRRWALVGVAVALVGAAAALYALVGRDRPDPTAPPPRPAFPATPFSCRPDDPACTRPGTVRWSTPLGVPAWQSGSFLYPLRADGSRVPRDCAVKTGPAYYRYSWESVRAYDVNTGRTRWTAEPSPAPPGAEHCELRVGGNRVVLVADGQPGVPGTVTVFDAETGRVVGTWPAPYPYSRDVAGYEHLVAVDDTRAVWATSAGEVRAVELTTGRPLWIAKVPPFIGFHVEGGTLWLDDSGGDTGLTRTITVLQRLDLATGTRSALPLAEPLGPGARLYGGDDPDTQYAGLDGMLFVDTNDAVTAVSSADGAVRWRHLTSEVRRPDSRASVTHIRAVDSLALTLYLHGGTGRVAEVDVRTGARSEVFSDAWIKGWAVVAGVAIHADVERREPFVAGVDPRTGEIRWRMPGPRGFSGSNGTDSRQPQVMVALVCTDPALSPSPARTPSPGASAEFRQPVCPQPLLIGLNF